MSFQVVGDNGTEFSCSSWEWRPLWEYCLDMSPMAQTVRHGHYNDGDGLGEFGAKQLASDLKKSIANGRIDKYELPKELAEMSKHYKFCKDHVTEFVNFLEHCGGFKII